MSTHCIIQESFFGKSPTRSIDSLGHLAPMKDINEIPEGAEGRYEESERYLHYLTSVIEQKNTFVIWIDTLLYYGNLASHKKTRVRRHSTSIRASLRQKLSTNWIPAMR